MYYYHELKDKNGFTYSCDSIRLEFQLVSLSSLLIDISNFCLSRCDSWYQSFRSFNYKYCFNFNLDNQTSFTILVGLNTYSKCKSCFVIDFNPNKCMKFDKFKKIVTYLFEYCSYYGGYGDVIKDVVIKRYDLAIDIPCDRKLLSVVWTGKGARHYELFQNTIDDRTEYFGIRNSIGRIKIYNKSLEDIQNQSKDDKEKYKNGLLPKLSRIEVTHNTLDSMILYSSLPCTFTKYDLNYLPDGFNTTDYILVNSCRDNDKYIPYLKKSRKMWKRLKDYIISQPISYDIDIIGDILFQICCYTDISCYDTNNIEDLEIYIDSLVKNSYDYSLIVFGDDELIEYSSDSLNLEDFEFVGE